MSPEDSQNRYMGMVARCSVQADHIQALKTDVIYLKGQIKTFKDEIKKIREENEKMMSTDYWHERHQDLVKKLNRFTDDQKVLNKEIEAHKRTIENFRNYLGDGAAFRSLVVES
jgi:predicted RNase H-like nuclease (RuvC/YqgF family)